MLSLLSLTLNGQLDFRSNDFYIASMGAKFYSGLTELNGVLTQNGHLPVSEMGLTFESGYSTTLNKITLEGTFLTSYANNTNEANNPHVTFTDLEAKFKVSYILVGQKGNGFFTEIGAGLGFFNASFSMVFPDSAASFNQALSGQTNYYYDQAIGFGFSPHLRIGKRNLDGGRNFLFLDLGYHVMFNKFQWRLSDLPLDNTNGLSIRAGISFPLRLKYNSYEN